ncbi:MAG: glutathione-disulfide reductase [Pseudomonadota bacterium]
MAENDSGSEFDFDLFVIGGGSGGVRAARISAQAGARVGLAEEFRYGGTCVIRGCVPKKLMVYASNFADAFDDAEGFGWSVGSTSFDWWKLISAKDEEIDRLEKIFEGNLRNTGVQTFDARATVADAHTVALSSGERFTAKHILIATGATPFIPDIPGADLGITSNEIFDLTEQPKRMVIYGGGYIACEFAGILNGLGTEVIQVYRGPQILRGFDDDVRNHVADAMRARGVDIRTEEQLSKVERVGNALVVTLQSGETVETDQVMFATGRIPNVEGLGLDALGVGLERNGAVQVDDWSQTSVPSIFAIGDVTDRVALTPVAIREGHAFADTVFGANPRKVDHSLIPSAVFTQPEVGTVGVSEAAARDNGPVEIYRSTFRPMLNVLAGRDERMLMKLIVAKDTRKVIGCHIVGHGAGEMAQIAAIPIGMGATKEDFDATIAVHPTAAEELVLMRTPLA